MVINRGEVWWADLSDPIGSSPGYRRPVIIISADAFNHSNIQTVVVVVITSNLSLADAPGNVLITKRQSFLEKDSVANLSKIVTIDKGILLESPGKLSPKIMDRIERGVRLVLRLT